MPFVLYIRQLLEKKAITIAILLIAIISRVLQNLFFFNIRSDASYQILATDHFIHGHDISLAKVLPQNLSHINYEPLTNWPPGFSILILPFFALFNHDYVAAGLTLFILNGIVLLWICRNILKLLDTPLFIINIYTLVAGFFIYPFYFKASSDAYAITFFVLAVYVTLLLLRDGSRWKYKIILLIACLFCGGMIKYLFIPLAFVIPYFLFSVKTLPDQPYIKKAGIVSFVLLLLLFGGFIAYQKMSAGTAGYIASDTRGLFASNLKQLYPYFPASFINPDTLASILNLSNNVITAPFQHLHFFCLVIAFCYFIYYIFWKGFNNRNLTTAFFLVTALIAFMLTILLAGLSLSIGKEEEMPGVFWTYVQEPRYYGLIIILLQLALAASYKVIRTKKVFYSLFLIASMALLIETGRGLYFSFNRLSKMGKEEYSWQYEKRFQEFAHSVIQQSKGESKLDHVVVTSSHYYWMHRVGLKSHVPLLYEPSSVNELQLLETQKPTLLIVILHEDQLQDYQPFLSNPLKKTRGTFDRFHFFSTHIMPYH